jgi:hypothetical protein
MNRYLRAVCIVVTGVGSIVLFNSAVNGCNSSTTAKAATPTHKTTTKAAVSPLKEFQACVAKTGTATEKAAVKHVVKITNMDGWNGVLDNPKVWTDYRGGIAAHGSDAVLIASAFAGCYESNNGLVTVFDKDGHVAGNGQF